LTLSVLDLAPILQGGTPAEAFRHSLQLAQHAEQLGYRRFWLAEHHNMPGIGSAATSVLIGHVGAGTSRIRIGAGGIMLPNHAPLQVAEQFGTLEALFPGRIDLGLGRAPGTDQAAAFALRRTLHVDPNNFPNDVLEVMEFLADPRPGQAVHAVPGVGLRVPIWILGSSTFGAEVAAALGLPFAFASHFAPAMLFDAIGIYRERFQPSAQLAAPYVMLGVNVVAADTDDEARFLASSGAPVVRQPALRSADPAAAAVEGVGARPARCRRSASAVARLVRRRAGHRGRGDARVRGAHAGRRADGRVAHLRSVGPPAVLRDRRGHDDRVARPALLISRAVALRIRRTRP
jgi:luciferase family oxidoreductase group 1